MTDLLSRQDARIHRCTCGAWVYRAPLCPSCTALSTGLLPDSVTSGIVAS